MSQTETHEEVIARLEQRGTIVPDCEGCRPLYKEPFAMYPRHKASPNCESGKRPHCTCSRCF